jgi:hypothetical protein
VTTPQQPGQQPGAAGQPFGQPPYGQQPATGPQPFASPQQFGQQPAGQFGAQPAGPGAFGQPAAGPGAFGQPPTGPGAFGQPGAGPEAFGQPPAGQQNFGQAPGFPPPGQPSTFGPAAPGAGGFGPAMPPGRSRGRPAGRIGRISRKVRYIRLGISAVVIVVALIVWLVNMHSDPGTAQVGDCMGSLPTDDSGQTVDASDAKKVDCTDPSAAFKVLGRKDNTSMDTFNNETGQQLCGDFPGTDKVLEISNSDSDSSSDGTLFCLESIKH